MPSLEKATDLDIAVGVYQITILFITFKNCVSINHETLFTYPVLSTFRTDNDGCSSVGT